MTHISYGNYQTENGLRTSSTDPERLVWYGVCGMWTDNWDKVGARGVPYCSACGALGFQVKASEWLGQPLDDYDKANPGYKDALMAKKEFCPKAQKRVV